MTEREDQESLERDEEECDEGAATRNRHGVNDNAPHEVPGRPGSPRHRHAGVDQRREQIDIDHEEPEEDRERSRFGRKDDGGLQGKRRQDGVVAPVGEQSVPLEHGHQADDDH